MKIAPRGGFSYSLNTNTVLRGGYGLFYAPWNYSASSARPGRLHPRYGDEPVRPRDRGAAHVVGEPVPGRPDRADWQPLGLAHQYRRHCPLRRPEQGRPEGAPVPRSTSSASCPATWRSPSATSAPPDATSATSARPTSIEHQHQPDRSGGGPRRLPRAERDVERRGAARQRRQPVLRGPRHRRVRHPADDSGRPAAAAVPAVRRRLQVRDDRRRTATVPRRDVRAREAHHRLVGRPVQLHAEPGRRQPVRAGQHLPDPDGAAAEQLRPRRRVRHQQLRFAAPHHPGADHEVPQLRQGRDCGAVPRRLECVSGGRTGQRLAAERRHDRPARPSPTSGSSAAGSAPTWSAIRTPRAATPIGWRLRGQRGRPVLRQRRLRQSRRRARSATPRGPTATRAISSARTSTW